MAVLTLWNFIKTKTFYEKPHWNLYMIENHPIGGHSKTAWIFLKALSWVSSAYSDEASNTVWNDHQELIKHLTFSVLVTYIYLDTFGNTYLFLSLGQYSYQMRRADLCVLSWDEPCSLRPFKRLQGKMIEKTETVKTLALFFSGFLMV